MRYIILQVVVIIKWPGILALKGPVWDIFKASQFDFLAFNSSPALCGLVPASFNCVLSFVTDLCVSYCSCLFILLRTAQHFGNLAVCEVRSTNKVHQAGILSLESFCGPELTIQYGCPAYQHWETAARYTVYYYLILSFLAFTGKLPCSVLLSACYQLTTLANSTGGIHLAFPTLSWNTVNSNLTSFSFSESKPPRWTGRITGTPQSRPSSLPQRAGFRVN